MVMMMWFRFYLGAILCALLAVPATADPMTFKTSTAFNSALAGSGLDVGGEDWDDFSQGTTIANNTFANDIRYQTTAGDSVVTTERFFGIIEGNRLGRTPFEVFFENDSINFAFAAPQRAFGISFRSLAWRDETYSITTNTGRVAASGLDSPQERAPGFEHFAGLIDDVGFNSVTIKVDKKKWQAAGFTLDDMVLGSSSTQEGGAFVLFSGGEFPDAPTDETAGLYFLGNQPTGTFPFVSFNNAPDINLGQFNPFGEIYGFAGGEFPGFSPHTFTGVPEGGFVPDVDVDVQMAVQTGIAMIEAGQAFALNEFFPAGNYQQPGDFLEVPLNVLVEYFSGFNPNLPGTVEAETFMERVSQFILHPDDPYTVYSETGSDEFLWPHDDSLGVPALVLNLPGAMTMTDPDGNTIYVIQGASVNPVPEPGTIALMLMALVGFAWVRRRR